LIRSATETARLPSMFPILELSADEAERLVGFGQALASCYSG
jgi:hypothetical protein